MCWASMEFKLSVRESVLTAPPEGAAETTGGVLAATNGERYWPS